MKSCVENSANISIGHARNILALCNLQRVSTSIRMTRGWIFSHSLSTALKKGSNRRLQVVFAQKVPCVLTCTTASKLEFVRFQGSCCQKQILQVDVRCCTFSGQDCKQCSLFLRISKRKY